MSERLAKTLGSSSTPSTTCEGHSLSLSLSLSLDGAAVGAKEAREEAGMVARATGDGDAGLADGTIDNVKVVHSQDGAADGAKKAWEEAAMVEWGGGGE